MPELELTTSEQLFKDERIAPWKYNSSMFKDKTVMIFELLDDAIGFGICFLYNHIIPRYGEEDAKSFPMARSEPCLDAEEVMSETIELKETDYRGETWLLIPTEHFGEVEEYLNNLFKRHPKYNQDEIMVDNRGL